MAWKEVKLEDITLKLSSGSTPKGGKDSYKEEGISLIRSLNVHDFNFLYKDLAFIDDRQAKKLSNVIVEENDILLNITGASVGRCTIVPKNILPARVNQHVMIIRVNPKLANSNFLLYLINSKPYKSKLLMLSETGATREALTKDDISSFKIKLPNIEVQNKIAKLLSNYDDLIENNSKRIKLLEQTAEEIYKEWFVRLRFPNYQNTKIEDGIPKGWEEKRILEFGKVIIGKTPLTSKEEYYYGAIPFIKTPDFRQGIYIVNTEETLSKTGASSQKNQFIPENSICVSCIGTVGEVVLTTKKSQTNQQINTIILNDLNYLEYLYFSLKNLKPLIQAYASTGATMGNLSKGKFEQIKILSPNEDLVISYSKLIKPMFKEIKNLMFKTQILKETRDLLLPRLLSGKLDIEKLDIN